MTTTVETIDYAQTLSAALERLVRDLEASVEDGDWAVAEISRIDSFVRADLIPWAYGIATKVDQRSRTDIHRLLRDLLELDAELLGTVGSASAAIARQLTEVTDHLLASARTPLRNRRFSVPQQRDKAT